MAAKKTSTTKTKKPTTKKTATRSSMGRATPDAPRLTLAQKKEMDRWQAEDDMRTLQRAREIIADNKRKAAAQAMAAEQLSALQKLSQTLK
jgi:hypothetical protein